MIYSIIANIVLLALLVLSIKWGLSRGSHDIKKNVNVLLDHSIADAEIRKVQESVTNKIVEAKNRNEADKVVNHIFNIARNSKLSDYKTSR